MCIIERDGKVVIIDQATEIERLNAVIDSCHEDLNCKSDRIDELEACLDEADALIKKNADQINALLAQVAALQEIAVSERANTLFNGPWDGGLPVEASYDATMEKAKEDARRQLAEKHPKAFR